MTQYDDWQQRAIDAEDKLERNRGARGGSVLQDWVMTLPLRAQGTLLTGIRGCDETPKYPLDSPERHLVAWMRWCVMNPADEREVDSEPGCFQMSTSPRDFKPSGIGHLPHHYVMHVTHVLEVIGYCHSHLPTRMRARALYNKMAKSMHLTPETNLQMWERLTEDRIATGTVVS